MSPARRIARQLLAFAAGLAFVLAPGAARAEADALEYAIKATYLYKFAPFVEWSHADAEPASGSFALCVVGKDPFGELLDRAVRDQRLDERPIVVRRLAVASREADCRIMYIADSEAQTAAEALAVMRGLPVLTVTDSARDEPARGIINFLIQNNRVRFEIDNGAAAESGLTISSKLLSLAVSVKPRT